MDQHKPKSNLRHLHRRATKGESVEESKAEVASSNDEVKASTEPAEILPFRTRRLKGELTAAAIYEKRLPELLALNAKSVLRMNLPAIPMVVAVLGVLPKLGRLRGQFEATLRDFDLKQFDGLEEYCFTLYYANTLVLGAERRATCPPEVKQEVVALQRALLADCRALEERGLLDRAKRRHFQQGKGFQIWASNLAILAQILRDSWPAIEGRCATSAANLKRADELANELLSLASRRADRPANIARARDIRARAFTLLLQAYQRARFAALYVLGDEHALEDLTPRLSRKSGRGRRKPKSRSKGNLTNLPNADDSTKQ
jgi:hypothetical protein